MVGQIPDPPKEEPSVDPPSDLAAVVVSDSEEEEDGHYDGYTILPADPNEEENDFEEEEDDMRSSPPNITPVEPSTFDKATTEEKIVLWSSPPSAPSQMSTEQTDAVLKAMEGFKLPSSAVPPWAVDVSEEEWKNHLLSKIRSSP